MKEVCVAKPIQYKRELFNFINDLTAIAPSIGFEVEEDHVVVRKCDKNRTIPYILEAPKSYFDIEDDIAFYNFSNFYSFVDRLKEPTISIDYETDRIQLNTPGTKVGYLLSDLEGIVNGPDEVDFGDTDVTFKLSHDDLTEIVKMNNLIKGEKASLLCNGGDVTITIYPEDDTDNTFEKHSQVNVYRIMKKK